MDRHFTCTACGKCCYGLLPLTLKDAFAHAHRFPLALLWTPVRQASKAFEITARLGTTVRLPDRKTVAVRIVPTGYIPAPYACPALAEDGLCSIHEEKPSRCRTMPFFPYWDEDDQSESLLPRPGWECDVSERAELVYRNKVIVDRRDFDEELHDLTEQVPLLRSYAATVLATSPDMPRQLAKAAMKPGGGHVVTPFSSLFPRLPKARVIDVAQGQGPILRRFAERTVGDPRVAPFHKHYVDWAMEMERIAAFAAETKES